MFALHVLQTTQRNWSFQVPVLQRTAKKCTNSYNARVQLLFCSLNLLFGDVLVAVDVVFCVRYIIGNTTTAMASNSCTAAKHPLELILEMVFSVQYNR